MDTDLFCRTFPKLYHMAHHEALPSIKRFGLMSTSALLDHFEIAGEKRISIERTMRRECIPITHPIYGTAVIRDQKPIMNDRRLEQSLGGTATASEFHLLLNGKVFFWVNAGRLGGLRDAQAYRGDPQLILTLDTRKLVESYHNRIKVCPMNSGACRPFAHPRSPAIFQAIADYDFEFWSRKKGGPTKAVVECTVEKVVHDVERFILDTKIVGI